MDGCVCVHGTTMYTHAFCEILSHNHSRWVITSIARLCFIKSKILIFPASKIEHCSPIQNVVLIPYASRSLKLIWQAYFIAFVGVFIIAKLFVLKIVYFSAMGMLAGSRAQQRRRTPNIWLDVRHHPGELSHSFTYEGKKEDFFTFHFVVAISLFAQQLAVAAVVGIPILFPLCSCLSNLLVIAFAWQFDAYLCCRQLQNANEKKNYSKNNQNNKQSKNKEGEWMCTAAAASSCSHKHRH